MKFRSLFASLLFFLSWTLFTGVRPAAADSSHVRIIRLSLVQGDVRFTRESHGDPLADQKTVWETAELNLPIRQGYVLATDNGRAEIEFENGAMAFLNENTVLEFYDLSLEDGARTTRLVLRQGTASFYVNPARGDYFSVTGGDFTVEANGKTTFRVDNFDDGSNVDVLTGRVSVLHKDETTALVKGQSLSARAGVDAVSVGRLPNNDEFDQWVSGRIDSVVTATTAAMQYTSSPYYSAGFSDLYTYGSWFPVSGYGNCWRPNGVGFGWSPFDGGSWFFDPVFGWTFFGSQPWGWLPYHFGGWIFDPAFGWLWVPGGFGFGGFVDFRPVTGRFVRGRGGVLGVVPVHPLDVRGGTPHNLARGVLPIRDGAVTRVAQSPVGEDWKVLKRPPRDALSSSLMTTAPPVRVSRTLLTGGGGSRIVSVGHDSSIVYDPREHRFINTNTVDESVPNGAPGRPEQGERRTIINRGVVTQPGNVTPPNEPMTTRVPNSPGSTQVPAPPATPREVVPPRAPRVMTPPPPPRASGSGGERVPFYGGGGNRAGSSGRGYSGGGAGRGSAAPAPAPHPAPSSGRPH